MGTRTSLHTGTRCFQDAHVEKEIALLRLTPSVILSTSFYLVNPTKFVSSLSFFPSLQTCVSTGIKSNCNWDQKRKKKRCSGLELKPRRRYPVTGGHQICQGPFPQARQGSRASAAPIVGWSKPNQKVREAPSQPHAMQHRKPSLKKMSCAPA